MSLVTITQQYKTVKLSTSLPYGHYLLHYSLDFRICHLYYCANFRGFQRNDCVHLSKIRYDFLFYLLMIVFFGLRDFYLNSIFVYAILVGANLMENHQ